MQGRLSITIELKICPSVVNNWIWIKQICNHKWSNQIFNHTLVNQICNHKLCNQQRNNKFISFPNMPAQLMLNVMCLFSLDDFVCLGLYNAAMQKCYDI